MSVFGKNESRTYFKIQHGKIVVTVSSDNLNLYEDLIQCASKTEEITGKTNGKLYTEISMDNITAQLVSIAVKESTFGKTWNVTFLGDDGQYYVWSTYYDGGLFQGFVNCLAGVEGDYGRIKIQPWQGPDKKGVLQTKISLSRNGEKMSWKYGIEDMPKITPLKDEDGKDFIDDKTGQVKYNTKKRMMWLLELVAEIQAKLGQQMPTEGEGGSVSTSNANARPVAEAIVDEVPF